MRIIIPLLFVTLAGCATESHVSAPKELVMKVEQDGTRYRNDLRSSVAEFYETNENLDSGETFFVRDSKK